MERPIQNCSGLINKYTLEARKPNNSDEITLISLRFSSNSKVSSGDFIDTPEIKPYDFSVIPGVNLVQESYLINNKEVSFTHKKDSNYLFEININIH
ncbi:hypothetical protein MAH1_37030 [Sessilibacter sp. MAH1]